jgi:DNA-binding CsgD family transcriptional regulator
MPDLVLSDAEQTALRSLLATEPDPGSPLPASPTLEALGRLIPCDAVGFAVADDEGWMGAVRELPHGYQVNLNGSGYVRPMRLGILHWTRVPSYAEALHAAGLADCLAIGFRHGTNGVARVWLDCWTGAFTERDQLMLSLLGPALQRLVWDTGTARLPEELTVQERRTLTLVATGLSNPEVAERMSVATCTVRKHLEHAYRKLGVTNRLAAVMVLQGRTGDPDLQVTADAGARQKFA